MNDDDKKAVLIQVQFGIFFSNPIARPDLLTRKISDDYSSYFDSPPINLPVPAELIDFPSAQLQSSNNYWQINVSRLRADIIIIFKPEDDKTYDDIIDELQKIEEILKKLSKEARDQKVDISRVTSIGNFIMVVEDPVQYLQDTFLKTPVADRKEVVIKFNDPITEEDLTCNNLIQYVNGISTKIADQSEYQSILITRDFNTDPKKKMKFTDDELAKFFKIAKKNAFNPGIK